MIGLKSSGFEYLARRISSNSQTSSKSWDMKFVPRLEETVSTNPYLHMSSTKTSAIVSAIISFNGYIATNFVKWSHITIRYLCPRGVRTKDPAISKVTSCPGFVGRIKTSFAFRITCVRLIFWHRPHSQTYVDISSLRKVSMQKSFKSSF